MAKVLDEPLARVAGHFLQLSSFLKKVGGSWDGPEFVPCRFTTDVTQR